MDRVYDLFSDMNYDEEEYNDISKNIKKYVEKLEKILSKKYKTLFIINDENAGHIIFRFKGSKANVTKNMAQILKTLLHGGIAKRDIYDYNISEYGDTTMGMGVIESDTINVLLVYYKELNK